MLNFQRLTLTLFFLLFCTTTWGQIPEQKSLNQYNQEVSQWMVAEATAKTSNHHELAVIELARLYGELASDSRIRLSPTLNQYRVKVRARLMRVLRELELRLSRDLRPPDRSTSDRLQSTLQRHLEATSRSAGGAGAFLGPRAGANSPDYGPHLIALIQRTIAPEHWKPNGGPGIIVYYPPLRLLVVRATSQVHSKIRDLNNKLR